MTASGIRLPGWLHRHGVSILFLLGVCAMSLSLSWQTLDLVHLLRSPAPAPAESSASAQRHPIAMESLQGLFGTPLQHRGDQQAPATTMQLTLLGSFVSPDSQRSTAIVMIAGGKPKRLSIGDEISDGVRLQAVHQDHVVLSRNGRDESLRFARQRGPAAMQQYNGPEELPPPTADQLEQLQGEDVQLLQQRMELLRQQMDDDGTAPPPAEAPEDEITQ